MGKDFQDEDLLQEIPQTWRERIRFEEVSELWEDLFLLLCAANNFLFNYRKELEKS